MIQFHNLYKKYPNGYEALIRINFHLPKGKLAFLTGHSGAGKSTFLKIIAGLESATRGQAMVNGIDLTTLKQRKIPEFRRKIGLILQDPFLLNDKTIFENVALPLIIQGKSKSEYSKKVQGALDKVGLLNKKNFLATTLSAGEQQRVGLARALVGKPDLLLADEPTGNLDSNLAREILSLFLEFNRLGTTMLIVTHNVELIKTLGQWTIGIEQGRLIDF